MAPESSGLWSGLVHFYFGCSVGLRGVCYVKSCRISIWFIFKSLSLRSKLLLSSLWQDSVCLRHGEFAFLLSFWHLFLFLSSFIPSCLFRLIPSAGIGHTVWSPPFIVWNRAKALIFSLIVQSTIHVWYSISSLVCGPERPPRRSFRVSFSSVPSKIL